MCKRSEKLKIMNKLKFSALNFLYKTEKNLFKTHRIKFAMGDVIWKRFFFFFLNYFLLPWSKVTYIFKRWVLIGVCYSSFRSPPFLNLQLKIRCFGRIVSEASTNEEIYEEEGRGFISAKAFKFKRIHCTTLRLDNFLIS